MVKLRPSEMSDISTLKTLWKLAFGDEDAYIDHFFAGYYAPERMLVLEEDGAVRAMTAWFDMPLTFSDGTKVPSAYLYAVATQPDCRGRGLAGTLLAFADQWLEEQGFACLTTVPARPDLHKFFGQNGFEECFVLEQREYIPRTKIGPAPLTHVGAVEYALLRERMLEGTDHIAYAPEALTYQAGVCALSGGGLYRVGEIGCACVELSGDQVFVKELLCPPDERECALIAIAQAHPAQCYRVRGPYQGLGGKWDFAMIKWLCPPPEWHKKTAPYLGLAFD